MYRIIILLLILLIGMYILSDNREHYYDITPYNLHWNVFKCLNGTCAIKKSYDCFKYCDYIKESGAMQQCKVSCLNVGDEMFDYLKYQNYNWPVDDSNRFMGNYTVLNNTGDYVNVDENIVRANVPEKTFITHTHQSQDKKM